MPKIIHKSFEERSFDARNIDARRYIKDLNKGHSQPRLNKINFI